jgi:prepilin-type N-terminal cleavage/methylation domain-containing protein
MKKGFTLIELLIVIAVIAILAAVAFVALDPLTRFRDARDATRHNDINSILSAAKIDQIDNGGAYVAAISGLTAGEVYMIVNGATMTTGCDDNNGSCDTNVTSDTHCANLAALVTEAYLPSIPVSPTGAVTWDDGSGGSDEGSGYTISRASTNILTIRSCESENTTEISVAR